jgi:AcrR family transcriptional regulator
MCYFWTMRTKNKPIEQTPRSFIETARRAQIIACAIETIAALGYAQASLAQIGKRCGVSKGVITYHFASKDELMNDVASEVLANFAAFVVPRMEGKPTVADELGAFFEANAAFLQAHRPQILVLLEITDHLRQEQDPAALLSSISASDRRGLGALLRRGQAQGEFRDFDSEIMAAAILALRNSMIEQATADPGLDLTRYVRELVTMITLATRRNP